jgi:hypothetical protein
LCDNDSNVMMGMSNVSEMHYQSESQSVCDESSTHAIHTTHSTLTALNASLIAPPIQSQQWTAIDSVNIDMSSLLNSELTEQTILLMPSAIDLMAAVDTVKPSAVQMMISSLPMITTATPVNVIQVPTNILLADNVIVIPQESITIDVCDTTSANLSALAISSPIPQESDTNDSQYDDNTKKWYNNAEVIALYNNQQVDQMTLIGLEDRIDDEKSVDIDNSISLAYPSADEQNEMFEANNLMTLIDSNDTTNNCDFNALLASTLSSTVEEECDPLVAKQWFNDSVIAYRAMLSFKKTMSSVSTSPLSPDSDSDQTS